MLKRFLRRHLPRRDQLDGRWYLRPFRALLSDPGLWAIHRKGVARGFALGVFFACLPIPGLQTVATIAIVIWWRVNLPIAVVGSLVNNPFTMVQIYWLGYVVGARLLGWETKTITGELSIQWLLDRIVQVGLPMLLGGVVIGTLAAGTVYLALNITWRWLTVRRYTRRNRRRT